MQIDLQYDRTARDVNNTLQTLPRPCQKSMALQHLMMGVWFSLNGSSIYFGAIFLIWALLQIFPKVWIWFLRPFVNAFYQPRRFSLRFSDDEIRFECRLLRGKLMDRRKESWVHFSKYGTFDEIGDEFWLVSNSPGGTPHWQLLIPKRALGDVVAINAFRTAILLKLRSQQDLESPALWNLEYMTNPEDIPQHPRLQGWGGVVLRLCAVLALVAMSYFARDLWTAAPDVRKLAQMIIFGIAGTLFLVLPEAWLSRIFVSGFLQNWPVQLKVFEDRIVEASTLPWRLFGRPGIKAFDLTAFAATGALIENSESFLLEYPHRPGRIPSRSCRIPKRVFANREETDLFREFIESKLSGPRESVARPLSVTQ